MPKSSTSNVMAVSDTKALVEQMIPMRLISDFNKSGEADFSYSVPGQGRFRVNVFKQRGSMAFVIRLINEEIPKPEAVTAVAIVSRSRISPTRITSNRKVWG